MGAMPALDQLLVHLPEASCALGGGALFVLARDSESTEPLPRRVSSLALLLALVGVLTRAPQGSDAWLSPETLGRLGLPLLVWFALATGAALSRSRPRSARVTDLACLFLLAAPLLRLATWPTGDTAPLALLLAAPLLAYLLWRACGDLPAGLLGSALVAAGAGLAPWVDGLVWRDLIAPAYPAWIGAGLALVILIATLIGPQRPRRLLLGISAAQLALLLAAASVGTRHAMFGALGGAAWSWLAPLLALWALSSGLEESTGDSLAPLARNRPQRIAAGLAFLALCGAPLTPGFAARVSLSEATLRAGLTGPAALAGVALALLAVVGLRAALSLAAPSPAGPGSKEPWVFDHNAASVAAFLPWALVVLELAHPGFCGGGSWGS